LGHSAWHGYFLQSRFFDITLDSWLQNIKNSATQMVIECLAINGSITLDDLIRKTGLQKDKVIEILQNLSVQTNPSPLLGSNSGSKVPSDFDIQKQYYSDFISHALISKTNDTYGLSLFGVMLMISLIRYHFIETDNSTPHLDGTTQKRPILFYKDQFHAAKGYLDVIARNYKKKLPLIFEKWDFLRDQLGSYLNNSFDFIIYKNNGANRTDDSVWIGGDREFYEDIQALASNTRYHLSPMYTNGKKTFDLFLKSEGMEKSRLDIMDPRLIPIRQKLHYMEAIFRTDIPLTKSTNENHLSFANESESQRLTRLNIIESIFAEELTFLFYLNLNTIAFSGNIQHSNQSRDVKLTQDEIEQYATEQNQAFSEMSYLGSPIERLMAILTKDKEIEQWFTERIGDIMHYRKQTLNKMTEFYDKILDSHKYIKKDQSKPNIRNSKEIEISIYPEEYDIRKICSDFTY
jgi:hypothetical protein